MILEPDLIKKAEGSCLVNLGETKVLAGIKVDKGEPYPDTPDQAVMTTNAELVPLASPFFESGPPDEDSIELARVVDRGIREAPALDMSSLVVREGELVRVIFIDLHILDSDGNLFDASNIAAVTALHTTKIPVQDVRLDFMCGIDPLHGTALSIVYTNKNGTWQGNVPGPCIGAILRLSKQDYMEKSIVIDTRFDEPLKVVIGG